MKSMRPILTALFVLLFATLAAQAATNPCPHDQPCQIGGADAGTYQLALPEGWDEEARLKPFVFFHGHGGSGASVARNASLARELGAKGYVLVAPDGPLFNFRGSNVRGWAARPEGENPRGERDDVAFVEAVLADLRSKLPVDMEETVVSGFSSGGSMAWFFGCYSSIPVKGIVAVAGGLRRPLPVDVENGKQGREALVCPGGPRRLIHFHGYADLQVPLEGRRIRAWHQGDVFEGLAVQRHTNQCRSRPKAVEVKGKFWCRSWTGCESDKPLRFCLHPGGHGLPKGWLEEGLEWLE